MVSSEESFWLGMELRSEGSFEFPRDGHRPRRNYSCRFVFSFYLLPETVADTEDIIQEGKEERQDQERQLIEIEERSINKHALIYS